MTLLHIKYFIVTAECLSFTRAAEQLFISQPSLSRQIINMEKELNLLLFIRHRNHSIELTPAGYILLDEFRKIYSIYQKAVDEAQKLAFNITGSLRIGILQGTYVGDFMPHILKSFEKKYPNVHLDLQYYSFGELTTQLYQNNIDVILTLYFSIKELDNLNFTILHKEYDYIIMSKSHPLAQKASFQLKDLENERFLLLSEEDCGSSAPLIKAEFQKYGIYPAYVYVPDVRSLELLIESGYGISVIDSRSSLIFHPDVICHEFSGSWDPSLTAVWNQDNTNPMISIFLEIIKQAFYR